MALAVIAVVLLTAQTGGATAARPRTHCPRPLIVYYVNPEAVVWLGGGPGPEGLPTYYGCAYGHKAYELGEAGTHGTPTGTAGVRPLALSNRIMAYEKTREIEGLPGLIENDLIVVNLARRQVLYKVPTGTSTEPGTVGAGQVLSIVLKEGSVAWIAAGDEAGYQVHVIDKHGARTLAVGPEVDPFSLALGGSTLYWTQSGKPESSTLY